MFYRSFFVFLFITSFHLSSYTQYYKGKVIDENSKPLNGVHIYFSGYHHLRGTLSYKDGRFQIEAKPYQTLNFSYIGKKDYALQLTPTDTTDIYVKMQPEIIRLDEVNVRKILTIEQDPEYIYINDDYIFQIVAENPEFPGGTDSLQSYLNHSLIYPEQSFINGEEGQVLVQFTIDSKGKVVRPQIKKSVSPALNAEAIRVIEQMPTWKAGKNRGIPADCQFILPINFYISKEYRYKTTD